MIYKFKKDGYQKSRGGTSRVLDVRCEHCDNHVTFYQKDGPGMLKRMYIDRFIDIQPSGKVLMCTQCNRQLGISINYEKENRPAYRIFAGAITKKIIPRDRLS